MQSEFTNKPCERQTAIALNATFGPDTRCAKSIFVSHAEIRDGLIPAVTTVLVSRASLPDFGRPRPQYRHCFGELPSNARINVSLYSVWGTSHAV
jgi:hypothetical protein